MFDFDKVTDRRNTNSLKYDFSAQRGMPDDVLPLWVADMDFPSAPSVIQALEQAVTHGIFGYSQGGQEYFTPLLAWYRSRFG